MHGHLLDEDNFLSGHVLLLKDPFQLPQTGQRFGVLQRIDDEKDVMIHDRFIGFGGEPRAGPGWKTFEARLRETAEAVVKEFKKKKLLFFGKYCLAFGLDGQPNGEAVGEAFQRRGEPPLQRSRSKATASSRLRFLGDFFATGFDLFAIGRDDSRVDKRAELIVGDHDNRSR
jgi:hypothetical protein